MQSIQHLFVAIGSPPFSRSRRTPLDRTPPVPQRATSRARRRSSAARGGHRQAGICNPHTDIYCAAPNAALHLPKPPKFSKVCLSALPKRTPQGSGVICIVDVGDRHRHMLCLVEWREFGRGGTKRGEMSLSHLQPPWSIWPDGSCRPGSPGSLLQNPGILCGTQKAPGRFMSGCQRRHSKAASGKHHRLPFYQHLFGSCRLGAI
jgi:hypothetical protein